MDMTRWSPPPQPSYSLPRYPVIPHRDRTVAMEWAMLVNVIWNHVDVNICARKCDIIFVDMCVSFCRGVYATFRRNIPVRRAFTGPQSDADVFGQIQFMRAYTFYIISHISCHICRRRAVKRTSEANARMSFSIFNNVKWSYWRLMIIVSCTHEHAKELQR